MQRFNPTDAMLSIIRNVSCAASYRSVLRRNWRGHSHDIQADGGWGYVGFRFLLEEYKMKRFEYNSIVNSSDRVICSCSYKFHEDDAGLNRYFHYQPDNVGVSIGFRFLLEEKK